MTEQYVKYTLTNEGAKIMAKIVSGTAVTFKRIAIGDGYDYDTDNFAARTSLVNEVLSLTSLTMLIEDDTTVTFTGKFSQSQLENSFWYREIGLYVVDPSDSTKEILYAYGNRNDKAEYITPAVDDYEILKELKLYTVVGTSANVHINASESLCSVVEFAAADWTYDSSLALYTLNLGEINESFKVFKTTSTGKQDTALVDIVRNSSNITTLRALAAFAGCVLTA